MDFLKWNMELSSELRSDFDKIEAFLPLLKLKAFPDIRLSLANLIGADIAAASVLISMGALLGRISPVQLLVMGFLEIILFASNEFLQIELMKVR